MDQREMLKKIEKWYREMYPLLRSYGRKLLGSDALAEEAVQETFRIACGKMEALEASPNPEGWIVNTMKNVIRSTKRERDLISRMILETKAYEDEQHNTETRDPVAENVDIYYGDLIPKEEFELLKRLVFGQETIKEIADESGISYEACKKRIQRAKKKMEEALVKIQRR